MMNKKLLSNTCKTNLCLNIDRVFKGIIDNTVKDGQHTFNRKRFGTKKLGSKLFPIFNIIIIHHMLLFIPCHPDCPLWLYEYHLPFYVYVLHRSWQNSVHHIVEDYKMPGMQQSARTLCSMAMRNSLVITISITGFPSVI